MRAAPSDTRPDRISSYIAQLAQRLDAHVRDVAESLGITAGQTIALRELSEPLTLSELATRMACERPNATYVADRMEKQNLIERRAHPHDRRSKVVVLTPAGQRCRLNVLRALAENSPIDTMTPSDQAELADVLSRVVKGL
ncbi:MarR family winged helix-turn-helix transcriptional regulator [Gordonia sputi]